MDQGYANVALDFNSDSHSLDDSRFVPSDIVNNEMDRLCKETYWIYKLDTLHPKGMNLNLLYICIILTRLADIVYSYYLFSRR